MIFPWIPLPVLWLSAVPSLSTARLSCGCRLIVAWVSLMVITGVHRAPLCGPASFPQYLSDTWASWSSSAGRDNPGHRGRHDPAVVCLSAAFSHCRKCLWPSGPGWPGCRRAGAAGVRRLFPAARWPAGPGFRCCGRRFLFAAGSVAPTASVFAGVRAGPRGAGSHRRSTGGSSGPGRGAGCLAPGRR